MAERTTTSAQPDGPTPEGFALPPSHQKMLEVTDRMFKDMDSGVQGIFFIDINTQEFLDRVRQLPFGNLLIDSELAKSGGAMLKPWISMNVYKNDYQQYEKDEANPGEFEEIPGDLFRGRTLSIGFHYTDSEGEKTETQSIYLENIASGSGTPELFGVTIYEDPASEDEVERKQTLEPIRDEAIALAFLDLADELFRTWQASENRASFEDLSVLAE